MSITTTLQEVGHLNIWSRDNCTSLFHGPVRFILSHFSGSPIAANTDNPVVGKRSGIGTDIQFMPFNCRYRLVGIPKWDVQILAEMNNDEPRCLLYDICDSVCVHKVGQ